MLGTIWRRTPLRLLRRPYEHQTSHYGTRPAEPVQGDWLLGGACLLMRRSMLEEIGGWDGGFRHYVEDIDVAYRASQAGWERWLVPEAVVHHAYAAVIDKRFLSRHTLWHLRGMARFVRKHPERPSLPMTKDDQYTRAAERWTETQYAAAAAYLDHRADLIVSLGRPLEEGDVVLDLACGDGGLGEHLLARGLRYRGVDSTPEMVAEASRRLGDRADVELGDLNDYMPAAPVTATTCFRAIYYAEDRRAFFARVAGLHGTEARLRPQPASVPARGRRRRPPGRRVLPGSMLRPFFSPQQRRSAEAARSRTASSPSGPGHWRGSRFASGSRTSAPRRAWGRLRKRDEAEADLRTELAQVAQSGVDPPGRERRRDRDLDSIGHNAPGSRASSTAGVEDVVPDLGDTAEGRLLVPHDDRPDLDRDLARDVLAAPALPGEDDPCKTAAVSLLGRVLGVTPRSAPIQPSG